jgi:uncharacterized damage-inducible protein DinB
MHGYGSADLANAFRTVRKNTIVVANDIPEDKYDFVAVPGVRSVRDNLAHIAFATMIQEDMHRVNRVTTLDGFDFAAIGRRAAAEEKKPRTKAQIIDLLTSRGEEFASWMESLTPQFLAETFTGGGGQFKRTRFESLLGAKEHEMHHRAQLMLIERILGIVPHLTREREERNRQRSAAAPAVTTR